VGPPLLTLLWARLIFTRERLTWHPRENARTQDQPCLARRQRKAEIQAMLNRQLQIMMALMIAMTEPRLDLIMEELRLIRADLEKTGDIPGAVQSRVRGS
jgi:hypothetical protein